MKHVPFKHFIVMYCDSCSHLFTVKLFLKSTTRRINKSDTICSVCDDRWYAGLSAFVDTAVCKLSGIVCTLKHTFLTSGASFMCMCLCADSFPCISSVYYQFKVSHSGIYCLRWISTVQLGRIPCQVCCFYCFVMFSLNSPYLENKTTHRVNAGLPQI